MTDHASAPDPAGRLQLDFLKELKGRIDESARQLEISEIIIENCDISLSVDYPWDFWIHVRDELAAVLREAPEGSQHVYEPEKRCCTICDAKRCCHVCGEPTLMACADCRIDFGVSVYVCPTRACRDAHELKCRFKAREAPEARPRSTDEPDLQRLSDSLGWGLNEPWDIYAFALEREQLLRIAMRELETHKSIARTAEDALRERISLLKKAAAAPPAPGWQPPLFAAWNAAERELGGNPDAGLKMFEAFPKVAALLEAVRENIRQQQAAADGSIPPGRPPEP